MPLYIAQSGDLKNSRIFCFALGLERLLLISSILDDLKSYYMCIYVDIQWLEQPKNVHIRLAKESWAMIILSNLYQSYFQENEIKGIFV